ncbi:MAG: 2-C-methyl-D-erythritol 4-phosphate cytidylyltransferase [Eubacterium sp.]|nr:2-C-methyl-D-erythritol 4-phosphate cytidylyltransferase [Eubacterium sp.]
MSKVTAIVLAAGTGSRMQSKQKKQFMEVKGKPILWYSLFQFEQSLVDEVILVTGEEDIPYCKKEIVERYGFKKVKDVIAGGKERYHSVYNGLQKAAGEYVLIHDGARPMITEKIIEDTIQGIKQYRACVVGVPVKDTIKQVSEGKVVHTPDRNSLWITQTPQGFETALIKQAYEQMMQEDQIAVTDDAMVVEQYGGQSVYFVEGDYKNMKVTTPEDILLAEVFLDSYAK